MERRQYLQGLGGVAGLGLLVATAGCSTGGSDDTTTEASDTTTVSDSTTTEAEDTTTDTRITTTTESTVATTTQPSAETTTIADGTASVTIDGFAFSPIRLRVSVGTTVEWVNEGGAAHTVVAADLSGDSDNWSFDERLNSGASASHTFDSTGVYEYFCDIHGQSTMCGVVLVGDGTLSATLPCE